jgi:uncharacterized protein
LPLLIDGHNLIGANVFEDIRLTDEDDEARLVARLRAWKSRYPGKIEVIFDNGITEGRSALLSGGGVEVRFARNPSDADELIRRRVRHPKKDLILVTNDAALRQEAERHNVEVWRSDDFVENMFDPPAPKRKPLPGAQADPGDNIPDGDVEKWMRIFQKDVDKNKNQEHPTWTPPFKPSKRRRPNPKPAVPQQPTQKPKHGKRKR